MGARYGSLRSPIRGIAEPEQRSQWLADLLLDGKLYAIEQQRQARLPGCGHGKVVVDGELCQGLRRQHAEVGLHRDRRWSMERSSSSRRAAKATVVALNKDTAKGPSGKRRPLGAGRAGGYSSPRQGDRRRHPDVYHPARPDGRIGRRSRRHRQALVAIHRRGAGWDGTDSDARRQGRSRLVRDELQTAARRFSSVIPEGREKLSVKESRRTGRI